MTTLNGIDLTYTYSLVCYREHTTVLHLHLARVVLLTPFQKIAQLAFSIAGENHNHTTLDITAIRDHIHRWATQDQHKARLAMIHAGALFWHVRRFSADGFYEPASVFLATLAMWAYGTFAEQTSKANQDENSPQDDDEDVESMFPTSMQLVSLLESSYLALSGSCETSDSASS